MQRNELSQAAVQVTQEALSRKKDQQDGLKMKMQELSDQGSFFNESISVLHEKIVSTDKMQAEQRVRMQEQRRRENELERARLA